MRTRRKSYSPAPDMDDAHEIGADEYSDMESTDESSGDEEENDKVPSRGPVIQTDISSTESEFEGFGQDNLFELPLHFDRDDDLARFIENWEEGSRPRVDLPFTGRPGLDTFIEIPENARPLDYFNLFIQECDFEDLAVETNRYFAQSTEGVNLKPHARSQGWWDTNSTEMKVFFAATIAMTLTVQRDVRDYWGKHEVTEAPFVGKIMTRDRFWLLMTYLHLDDNTKYPGINSTAYTPLNKLGRLYKRICQRFTRVYRPHRHISIDEGMVPWRGNLSFRVYNPDKPKKYGMKAYMLCDSENGYVCKFKLYIGKYEKYEGTPSGFGHTYDIVMDLTKDFLNRGYHLFMDNYYSSPLLYVNLWERGIGATGTLRPNRKGTPKVMGQARLPEKQKPGDMICMHNRNLLCVRYQDKRSVVLMSTVDDIQPVETGKLNRNDGMPIKKPRILNQYNKFMGGVDRADQMLSYTPFKMRTLKWWKRVWFHILNVAILNAYVIYKMRTGKPHMSSRCFRREIVEKIVEEADPDLVPTMKRRHGGGRPSTSDSVFRLQGRHFPSKIVPVGKKKNISKRCVVCSKAKQELLKRQAEDGEPAPKRKRIGRESSFECQDCNATLCVAPCFRLYHTYLDYVRAYIRETTAPQDDAGEQEQEEEED